MTARAVQHALRTISSPTKAKSSAWFFKTGPGQYGEGDQFIGVTVPEQRVIAKKFQELSLIEIQKLLASTVHEDRLTALFILVGQYQRAKRTNAEKQFVTLYLDERQHINNWDLVDSSAPYILGDWLVTHPDERTILAKLAGESSIWSKRIAILATASFIKNREFEPTLRLAEQFLSEHHDLMHKATGWMLREIGKKDQPTLAAFLEKHAAAMPRTMLRYAIEKFSPAERQTYLSIKGR